MHQRKFACIITYAKLFFLMAGLMDRAFAQIGANPVSQPPLVQLQPQKSIDIRHIALDLKFDWQKKQTYGTGTLSLILLAPAEQVTLDAAQLSIHAIHLQNGVALRHTTDAPNNRLTITLDRKYKAGQTITLAIDYHTSWVNATDPANIWGSAGKGIRFLEPSATEPHRRKQIWSMGEGEGNRYWFPGNDVPGDLRTTEFKATVDQALMVVSNGQLAGVRNNGDGTHTFHYKMTMPYPNHKTAFVVGEYVDVPQAQDNVALHNYAYPDEKEATLATVERLPDMVRYFADLTGQPYPFPSYAQVFIQEFPWGYGSSGLSLQTENMVDDFPTHADYLYLWDMLEGESLASQWFGNFLSCGDWSHYWLDKAFSRYFSCLYDEYKNGKAEFLLYQLAFDQGNYFGDWNSGNRHPVVTDQIADLTAFLNDNYANSRGALVLHLLRKHLGEEKWRKAIRQYVKSNAGRPVTTEDLRKAAETAAGENMQWFFDQWVYQMGHPVFEVTTRYNATKNQLTLIAKQVQKPDSASTYPQTVFFKGNMEIAIDNRIEKVFIEPKFENVFIFSCKEAPRLVNFDYESAWIKEVKFEKSLDEWLYQLQYDHDVLGKRKAMNELAGRASAEGISSEDKAKIQQGFRKVILGQDYWRIRFNALSSLQNLLLAEAGEQPLVLDAATSSALLTVIKRDSAWVRSAAINFLGMTKDAQHADLYLGFLQNKSERVVNAAAIALGKCKSPKAFEALVQLKDKPSWKNQSLISSLNGLRELGDPRGIDFALEYVNASKLPHWTLATPLWDHRLAAAQTLVALGAADRAYSVVAKDFQKSVQENNTNDIFYNLLQITTLADARGQEAFDALKIKYKDDANALAAVTNLESQFQEMLKLK